MHKYLRAIGFSNIKKEELKDIFEEIMDDPTYEKITEDSEGNDFAEIARDFGDFFGINLRGTFDDEDEEFHVDYYYPYSCGTKVSTFEKPDIQKHAEKESYAGVCDEIRVGVTLIFYLQNICDYLSVINDPLFKVRRYGVVLSGLSIEGKILFPINKDERKAEEAEKQRIERTTLIAAARNGDEDAIENLTLEDIDTYSLLSRRIMREDILSIVENYFMPYGIESDQYSILGEIMEWHLEENRYTHEKVYTLELVCNDLPFRVTMNEKDLLGEPAVGRRFKGTIWLQGTVFYQD